ncbi:MAG TPA: LysR family transcriptional regulator [Casimicrobiaceae bacterium]|nr:LysR family transcriptional regulator [Casimicrobiaceae bacterium]
MKFESIGAFVAVAEAGSVSGGARQLALSKSVVSERLAELERSLGARLVQRTTRKLALTEDGAAFLIRARRILSEAEEARAELAERHGELAGPLRISAPVSFGTLHLSRAIFPFLRANPRIRLTLDLDDRFVDVVGEGYDAVIRHARIADARVVVKKLGASRRYLVASPGYLGSHGAPASVDELQQHSAIIYARREADWRLRTANREVVVRPERCLRLNNGIMMRDAAVAGLGIALLPAYLVQSELSSGLLQVVDVDAATESAEVFVAYPTARASAKLRALVDWLRRAFGTPPRWER